ncbi:hypothetical protein D3C79_586700 [compost metagenome]
MASSLSSSHAGSRKAIWFCRSSSWAVHRSSIEVERSMMALSAAACSGVLDAKAMTSIKRKCCLRKPAAWASKADVAGWLN